jgi:D-alanyl-D-alanine carboxypeptidase
VPVAVLGFVAFPAVLLALAPFRVSSEPLPQPVRTQLKAEGFWRAGCPVGLSDLRLLTVSHWGFDGRSHTGQLVVNAGVAGRLGRVFGTLYGLRFPIRHMEIADMYGPKRGRPRDGDVTASFDCRQAVPSPCSGGRGTGTWSMHAFGLAVDVNPVENPYVGCGQSRDPTARRFFDRSRHRKGMVTRRAIGAFRAVGWGWGGSWVGSTKDYMHFSSNGH